MDLKLFKILQTHYAPKDSTTAIKEFVVAKDDREVFEYLAKGYAHWDDIRKDAESVKEIYELDKDKSSLEEYEELMEEYEEIYNGKGDDREVYDLYYGATQYSWEEVGLVNDAVIELMIENGLAKRI